MKPLEYALLIEYNIKIKHKKEEKMRAYNKNQEENTGIFAGKGLIRREDGEYYVLPDGSFATGFIFDGEVYRYFDDEGKMLKDSFIETGEGVFYVDAEGARFSGKLVKKRKTYYFDRNGKLINR